MTRQEHVEWYMTRQEHVEWCKQRALEYLDAGNLQEALASMFSDLGKHPETENHPGMTLGIMMMAGGILRTEPEVRRFINGFN